MKNETIKICIDDCENGISGWLYNGHTRKRLGFAGMDELIRHIYRILVGVCLNRSEANWFSKENGFEDFESTIELPWSSKYLFTRRGRVGSIILQFSSGESLWKGRVMIINSGHAEYSQKFDSKQELESELARLSEVIVIDNKRERAKAFSKLMFG